MFQSVCCCKNDNCKNGNMADAWKCLTSKYAPNIVSIKLELKSESQQNKLWDTSQDPNIWILDTDSICARLKENKMDILDEDFSIVHILKGLPAEYEVQI